MASSTAETTSTSTAATTSSDEKVCRYCLLPEDEGCSEEERLISPCGCRGDQTWVHKECLRRWQRSVLVSQPTHPAFYEDDERQRICSVCRKEFSVPPPSRHEMMLSFTGPELAALLQVGCLIVCEPKTSAEMAGILVSNFHIPSVRSVINWIQGVYLITDVLKEEASDGEDAILGVNLTRPCTLDEINPLLRRLWTTPQFNPSLPLIETNEIAVTHFLGGPCDPLCLRGVTRIYNTTAEKCREKLGERGSASGVVGNVWACGPLEGIVELMLEDRAEGPFPANMPPLKVKAVWGHAGWSRTQLLGEMARGGWGMCRAQLSDVFSEDFQHPPLPEDAAESGALASALSRSPPSSSSAAAATADASAPTTAAANTAATATTAAAAATDSAVSEVTPLAPTADAEKVVEAARSLWVKLIASKRIIYTQRNDMLEREEATEQMAESEVAEQTDAQLQQRMAEHRSLLARQLRAQNAALAREAEAEAEASASASAAAAGGEGGEGGNNAAAGSDQPPSSQEPAAAAAAASGAEGASGAAAAATAASNGSPDPKRPADEAASTTLC